MRQATELADAEGKEHVANEAADLLYFALVACTKAGVTLSEVEHVLGTLLRLRSLFFLFRSF